MLILSRQSILVNLFIWCTNYYFQFESNQMTLFKVNPKIVQKSLYEFLIYVLDDFQNLIKCKITFNLKGLENLSLNQYVNDLKQISNITYDPC